METISNTQVIVTLLYLKMEAEARCQNKKYYKQFFLILCFYFEGILFCSGAPSVPSPSRCVHTKEDANSRVALLAGIFVIIHFICARSDGEEAWLIAMETVQYRRPL